jgi:hypothetical protein
MTASAVHILRAECGKKMGVDPSHDGNEAVEAVHAGDIGRQQVFHVTGI